MKNNDFKKFLRKEVLREWYRVPINENESEASEKDADESGSLDEATPRRIPSRVLSYMAGLTQNTNDSESGSNERFQEMEQWTTMYNTYNKPEEYDLEDPGWQRMMVDASELGWGVEADPEFEAQMARMRSQADSDMDVRRGNAHRMAGDEKYEYKLEDDKWFTRQQGTERWIDLSSDRFREARLKLDREGARREGDFPRRDFDRTWEDSVATWGDEAAAELESMEFPDAAEQVELMASGPDGEPGASVGREEDGDTDENLRESVSGRWGRLAGLLQD